MNHKWSTYGFVMVGLIIAIVLVGKLSVDQAVATTNNSDQTVLFSDDFSGDLSQWSDPIGPWNIDQEELVGQGLGGGINGYIYAGDTSWTDYTLQAKVMFVNDNVTLVFRSTGNWQNEYYIELWQIGGEYNNTYVIAKFQDGIQYDLGGGHMNSPVPITNPSTVNILISGNRLFLYINGYFVDEIIDPNPLPNGRIGMGVVWNYSARFDDVLVTTLPPFFILQPEQEKYGKPGHSVTYTVELENLTGESDSFSLEVFPGNVWTTTLSDNQVGPIDDGKSITFTVTADVPFYAQPGAIDVAIIQATSVNNPADTASTRLITTANSEELAYVPLGNSNALALIDTKTHTTLGSIDVAQFGCLAPQRARLAPDGAELYITCNNSSNILILKTVDLSWVATIDRPGTCEQDIAFVRDGVYALASTNNCGGVYQIDVIDTETHTIVQAIPLTDYQVISIAAHPSLPLAYAASTQCCYSGSVLVIDTNSFTIQTTISYPGIIWDVQPSPDGRWVYASEYFGNGLAKIDVNTNTIVNTLPNYGKFGLDISPDGSMIYATEMWDGVVHVIDTINMKLITTIGMGATTAEAELTCDGSELYVARETTSIPVVNTHTNIINYEISIPDMSSAYGIAICSQNLSDIYARKIVDKTTASPGARINYAIIASNTITDTIDNVTITDTLPISLTYKVGSLNASSGTANYLDGVITWTGEISPSTTVTVSFGAIVSPTATIGTSITNEAIISAEGNIYNRSATIDIVPYKVFMPCASRACLPSFTDNFSNPSSGWPIESGDGYWMGYQNGEYYIAVNEGWMAWAVKDFGVSDFQIEVDTWPALNLNGGVAILFSANDNGFYLFEINDGWFSLWRNDSYYWNWTPLIDWQYSSAIHSGFQANRLKVVRVGSNIKVYANGHLLGSVNDGTYRGTWSGLVSEAWLGYFDGRFDNFALYTGGCIGILDVPVMIDRASSFDAIYLGPGGSSLQP